MGLILFLIVGAGVGVVASKVLELDIELLPALGLGAAGALVGWVIKQFILAITGILFNVVFVIGGAILLVWAWNRFQK